MNILLFDLETAPLRAFTWGLWNQNISATKQLITDSFMLTWSAKWYGKKKVYGDKLTKKEVLAEDDKRICESLHALLDQADVIIGHNGDKFDVKVANTRFILNGLTPPSPSKQIDTLKMAKKHFRFTSNRLDYIGQVLGVGRKIDTGGFDLWSRCLQGEAKAMNEMLRYNKQDVLLLEEVYDKLKPFCNVNTNLGVDSDKRSCPKCGGHHLQSRGYAYTTTGKFQRFQCVDCGGWSRGRTNIRDGDAIKETNLNVS
jgi:hypothetical protein